MAPIPIRRVVTGNNERGQSKVVWDGPAPSVHEGSLGAGQPLREAGHAGDRVARR